MMINDITPALFVAMAVCGGGDVPEDDRDVTSPSGWTCYEIKLMIRAELSVGQECVRDRDCEQILPETGVCPMDDIVTVGDFEPDFVIDMIEEGEAIDCDLGFMTAGYCPEYAEPGCQFSKCTWRY